MAPSNYPPQRSYSVATLPYASLCKDRFTSPVYRIRPIYDQAMVTYHVCRVCGRPRSDRFHREHPLTINVVPPPPGICRRCRVSGEENGNSDSFQLPRSRARIGVECLVPETAVITQEEIKYDRGCRRVYREVTVRQDRSKSGRRVIYHVTLPEDGEVAISKKGQAAVSSMTPVAEDRDNTVAMQTQRPSLATVVDKGSDGIVPPRASDNPADAKKRYGYTEAEIRQLARDEVERYRKAERLIEDHPAPYAHGRLISLSRQLGPLPGSPATRAVEDSKPVFKASTRVSKPGTKAIHSPEDRVAACQSTSKISDKTQGMSPKQPPQPVKSQITSTQVHPPSVIRHQHDVEIGRATIYDRSRNKEQKSRAASQRTATYEHERTTVSHAKPVEVESVAQSPPALVSVPLPSKKASRTDYRSKDASDSSKTSKSMFESRRELDILIDDDSSALEQLKSASRQSTHTIKHTLTPARNSKHDHTPSMRSSNSISYRSKNLSANSIPKDKTTRVIAEEHFQPKTTTSADLWMSGGCRNDSFDDSDVTINEDFIRDVPRDRDDSPAPIPHKAEHYDLRADRCVAREIDTGSRDSSWTDREYWIDGCVVQASRRDQDGTIVVERGDGLRYYPVEDQIMFGMLPKTSTDAVYEVQSPAGVTIGSLSYRSSKESDHRSKLSQRTATNERAQPGKEATYDYEYRQRKMVPASGVVDMEIFEKGSPDIIEESEEIFVYKPQRSKASPAKASSISPADILKKPPTRLSSSRPSPLIRSEHASERTSRTGRTLEGTRQAQVHFANNVAISPTPPGSDDYPLTIKKSTDRSLRGLHQNLAKIRASSSRSKTNSTPSEPRDRRAEADISSAGRTDRASDRQTRFSAQDTEIDVSVDDKRLCTRALSESPSRERFLAKRDVPQSERSSSRHSPERRFPVPHGPYTKEEPRSSSMHVGCGSTHSRMIAGSVRDV